MESAKLKRKIRAEEPSKKKGIVTISQSETIKHGETIVSVMKIVAIEKYQEVLRETILQC